MCFKCADKIRFFIQKCIRSLILFIALYLVTKYGTTGKIPYKEIFMICAAGLAVQNMMDIYSPLIVIYDIDKLRNDPNVQ